MLMSNGKIARFDAHLSIWTFIYSGAHMTSKRRAINETDSIVAWILEPTDEPFQT